MPLGINFWTDVDGFWLPRWKQVGTNMKSKIDNNLEGRFFKNRALAAAGARFFRIWGLKLGAKTD